MYRYVFFYKPKNKFSEITWSFHNDIEILKAKTKYLWANYYEETPYYIRDFLTRKLYNPWLSRELGWQWREVENEKIQKIESLHHSDGLRCMG